MVDEGRVPPQPYFDQPEIELHLQILWRAFIELSTERQIGMGLGPIPVSMLRAYLAADLDLDGDEFDHCFDVIRLMDDEWLTMKNANPGDRAKFQVAPDDAVGVAHLFGKLEAKQSNKFAGKTSAPSRKKEQ